MYSYNYNIPKYSRNIPYNYTTYSNDDRFFGPSLVAPLLIGGIAGYAIGNNNNNRPFYPYPMYFPNNSTFFNTVYYYPF